MKLDPDVQAGKLSRVLARPCRIYLAGPMRGIPRFNFDAFDDARDALTIDGYEVVSPADLDRDQGFSPDSMEGFDVREAMRRDFTALVTCDGLGLLPGWESSEGAKAEKFVAEHCGLDISLYQGRRLIPFPPPNDSPTLKAHSLVHGDRGKVYSHPWTDFSRTALVWSALFDHHFEPEDVAMAMIAVKMSRLRQTPTHRDSVVDICGYGETYSMVLDRREELNT